VTYINSSNSQKKKNRTFSKRSTKEFIPNYKKRVWSKYVRNFLKNKDCWLPYKELKRGTATRSPCNITEEQYKKFSSKGIIAEAKCKCKDERGRIVSYTYAPANNEFGSSPEGWFCSVCGKGHLCNEYKL